MDFSKLFNKSKYELETGEFWRQGERIPEQYHYLAETNRYKIYCCITLTCAHCIDLLPLLPGIADGFSGDFVLIVAAEQQEADDLAAFLQLKFPVIAVSNDDMFGGLRVQQTPFSYFVNADFQVVEALVTETETDFRRLTEAKAS